MNKKSLYKYKEDLDSFFKELANPVNKKAPFTMDQIGPAMILGGTIFDMEGCNYSFSSFSIEQLGLLQQYNTDGKHYQFLCYPDIPAPVMRVLATYAELHPEPETRMELWKLGRSGIINPYIMDTCCCILEAGLNLADYTIIEKESVRLLKIHQEQAKLLGLPQDAIILKKFSKAQHSQREPVNEYIRSITN